MGKTKIDIGKAIEMRVAGATLREIGKHFGTSPEGVRQALQRAHKKSREQKRLNRLLVAASFNNQGRVKSPTEIAKTINDWAAILEAAKKGIALESEVTSLKERLSKVEMLLDLKKLD
jgi:hypothetical protein